MSTTYDAIAGRSVERLGALSDGVFAIAMTLLVLDLRVPAAEALHGDGDLFRHVFIALAPRFVPYLLSFISLGIFWVGQQTQLNHFARTDRTVSCEPPTSGGSLGIRPCTPSARRCAW